MVNFNYDDRKKDQRKSMLDYWLELMMSASEQLIEAQYVDQVTVDEAKKEMELVKNDPNSIFLYSFFQAEASAPEA